MGYSGTMGKMTTVEEKTMTTATFVSHEANLISCSTNRHVY